MAIRNRRGVYSDFDKTKMVDGEFAVVKSGDPDGSGKAVYISFESGTADRLALFEDLEEYGGKIDKITALGEELPIVNKTVDIPIPTVDISAAAGDIVEFSTGGDNMPMKAVEVSMSPIQDLNGYDAPWPAGGGKNLFDISTATVGRYINENGSAQSTTTTDWSVSDFIPVQASTTYTFTPNSTAGGSAKHGFYDSNKNFISVIASGPQTFTTPSNCAYVRVSFRTASENVQLEKGSTATAWEPYSNVCPITGRTGASVLVNSEHSETGATTYPITFTSAGTVYAGTVDLVSGELTVTHRYRDGFSAVAATWSTANGGMVNMATSGWDEPMASGTWYEDDATLCNIIQKANGVTSGTATIRFGNNNGNIYCYGLSDLGIASAADFKTWAADNGLAITYPLATPLTYTLTPVQVMSLLGENVVWSEDGTISNLKYSADISLVVADLYSKLSS